MFRFPKTQLTAGFTYIELIVVTSIVVLIFGAIITSFQFALELNQTSRAKLSALSLANDRMEYFRSLPYDDVGVALGFPAGVIPQESILELNGIEFEERVRVDYVDDPADGLLGDDDNAIIQDYKKIKLEYTWDIGSSTKQLELVSNIVPRSVETSAGGGTVRVNVLDADSSLLQGASVNLYSSTSPYTYNVTNPTGSDGTALFSVPADSGYQLTVTGNIGGMQYSETGTYIATTSNPNPVTVPFTVVESGISTLTFQIGALSDLVLTTLASISASSSLEEFADLSGVASSTNVDLGTGVVQLAGVWGSYNTTGSFFMENINPTSLDLWEVVRVVATVPPSTGMTVRIYTGSSTSNYTLVPDSELPGNSAGFNDDLIDISTIDSSVYPELAIGVEFTTTDTNATPEVDEIEVFWREGKTVRSGVSLDFYGTKIIGLSTSSDPIYKSTTTLTTNGSGEVSWSDLEFDVYEYEPYSTYDLARACPAYPIVHEAGVDSDVELLFVANAANTLRVHVRDSVGRSLPGATVNLNRSGYDETLRTDSCGQVFFTGGPTNNNDYELTVSLPGYATESIDPLEVNGDAYQEIVLTI